ncbi:MAG TPA: BrnA antitoxin family protein [Candidatus Woesebacteria bacterium]|nr:BrnA antitoxin family protein [Candidatus Woesebacteria bacterium]HNS95009.1 BrnA antitoxin family protein [Candidatus Woesebacteria bacterium]
MRIHKTVPTFKTEEEERVFWADHSPLDYPEQYKRVPHDFSNLKRSTRSVTFRIPESLFSRLKVAANKRDVPYQSLMKIFINDKLNEEYKAK